jgi:hypothetical protein
MIIFRPSIGNGVSVVSVDAKGNWFGKSLGNKLVKEVQTPTIPFIKVDSKLISTVDLTAGQQPSTWFYKDVTDFDFISGLAIYRCIYVGAESDVPGDNDFSEIIGTLTSSVSHTSPTTYPSTQTLPEANAYLDNTVSIEMWYEGLYNILSSDNTLSIDDEFDTTRKLDDALTEAGAIWQQVLTLNMTIVPGQYLKIWLKITPSFDRALLDYAGYSYTYSVGDLVIENINKATGRLNVAKVYNGPIDDSDGNILINQILPIQFEYNSIIKILEKNGYSNIFYLDTDNKMKDLIIKQDLDISENKYINYDFSTITGSITGSNDYTFARIIDCLNGGNIQSMNVVSNQLAPYLNRKTIIDIFLSKSDRSDAFLFFNELVSNSDTDYVEKFNHKLYSWNFGVIRLNLSFSNDKQFEDILPGLENIFNMEILDTSEIYILKPNHFATSVIQQDDLYTSLGFDIEDCRVNEKKSFITYIWEKDIVRPKTEIFEGEEIKYVKTYNSLLPKDVNNQVTTIKNRANTDAYLEFENISLVDLDNVNDVREIKQLNDGISYLKMGSCHEKSVNIGESAVSYDIVSEVDEFSTTIGLSIDKDSLVTATPITNSDSVIYDIEYPSNNHLLYQSDFNDYNYPELVYEDVTKTYFEEVSTRNDGLLTTIISNSSTVVPVTGSSTETVEIFLNKILPDENMKNLTQDYAHIVKISGDGNTALVIARNVIQVDDEDNHLYSFESSYVYLYKRCSGTWKRVKEITPKVSGDFTFGKFFLIEDENKVDISNDGNSIVISANASTMDVPVFGPQFSYDGYAVYYFTTSNDWDTYNQTRVDTTLAMNVDQREELVNDLSFGYAVSISNDADRIVIGSPSEFFDYVETDNHGAILNEYRVVDNGAVYVFTVNVTSPVGPAASGQDLTYGAVISGDVPLYFLERIIPNDSSDITVNGIIPDCITDGVYGGKRFGEKIHTNTDGTIISVGAMNDNQQGLHAGAVYAIRTPIDSCVPTVANTFIKVLPSAGYAGQQFSSYAMDMSRDGLTIVVGDANYNNFEGRVHVFDLDWFDRFTSNYVETILPISGFDDRTFNSILRKYGQLVNVSDDGSVVYVKDTYSIRGYSSTGIRGNVARDFSYDKKIVEFDKVENLNAITTQSGESLDMNGIGDVLIVGFKKENVNTEDRLFIQDYNPANYIAHTSASCDISGGNESIPVPYLIDIEQVPHDYIEQEIVGEVDPETIIGNEKQQFVYTNEYKTIFSIHCNGNENVVALTVDYNFYTDTWKMSGLNNEGQSVISTISPNVSLSPYFPNAITINTFRKQVNGYYCGKRYMLTYDIYVNGSLLYSGQTFTFDTTNSYVVTINPAADFSGSLTYWDVRNFLLSPLQYNKIMYGVISNKIWAELEEETLNTTQNTERFETFIYRRNLLLHNIEWDGEDDVVIPIVLQGNGYAVSSDYSSNITRSVFDFSNIDITSLSFGFTYEGSNEVLKWRAEKYDYNKDQLIVWVRLENWQGQRLIMYYGDTSLIKPLPINNLYTDFYGIWLMDDFVTISRLRYTDISIYDGGEALVLGRNGNYYLNQINKQYLFGNQKLYKSNKFDIYYDDIDVEIDREKTVSEFISTNVKLFAPGYMEIRNISSSDPADIESNQVDT